MSSKVLSKKDGWIGQITPSRPKVLNTIDDDLPGELANAVTQAHADPDVRLMILSGTERGDIGLCADLTFMVDTAKVGPMPARVWRYPTTAM